MTVKSFFFIAMLLILSNSVFSSESVFIRVTEVRKGCMGMEPQIILVSSNGTAETILLEKSKKFMSEDVMIKIKETLDKYLKLDFEISSSSSSSSGNPQECFYLTDYFLVKA